MSGLPQGGCAEGAGRAPQQFRTALPTVQGEQTAGATGPWGYGAMCSSIFCQLERTRADESRSIYSHQMILVVQRNISQ